MNYKQLATSTMKYDLNRRLPKVTLSTSYQIEIGLA